MSTYDAWKCRSPEDDGCHDQGEERPRPEAWEGVACAGCGERFWEEDGCRAVRVGGQPTLYASGPYCSDICAVAALEEQEDKRMATTSEAACAQKCVHEVGIRLQAHGPFVPPTVVPRPVYRCCHCGLLTDSRGEPVAVSEVSFHSGCGPVPAAGA